MKVLDDLLLQMSEYYDGFIVFLPKLIAGIVLSYLVYKVLSVFQKRMLKYLDTKTEDKLLLNFLDNIMNIGLVIFSIFIFLYIIGQAGLASGLLGAATISSVVIGFAFKDIAENFLAGVIMAFNRPFRVGDYVKTADVEGSIVEMSLRETHIKTSDGKDVYVPNGQIIKTPLYNYTIDGYLRSSFIVGVDYNSNVEKVRGVIQEVMTSIPGVLQNDKPPRSHVKNLSTNTIDIEVHYWVNTFDSNYSGLELKSKAQSTIIERLSSEGIHLPANIVEMKS